MPLRALLPETTFNYNQLDRTQQRDKPAKHLLWNDLRGAVSFQAARDTEWKLQIVLTPGSASGGMFTG